MRVHLAATSAILSYGKENIANTYILETYHAIRTKKNIDWIDPDYFLLDSGAYTYMRGNAKNIDKIDWDKYIEEYAEFIKRNKVKYFFELDIDSIIGYERTMKLTERLNELVGYKCIPVWHKSRGIKAYEKMLEDYEYISISASGNNNSSEWTRTKKGEGILRTLVYMAVKKGVKVHGLGFTDFTALKTIPFFSVDSTSWTFALRSGGVYVFSNHKIKLIRKPPGTRCKNKEVTIKSYQAWKQYQKYMLTK